MPNANSKTENHTNFKLRGQVTYVRAILRSEVKGQGHWGQKKEGTYRVGHWDRTYVFNTLVTILKPEISGPLYSTAVISTLVGCYIWYSEEAPGRAAASPSPLFAVPNVTPHPSTDSVPTSYYSMWHYNCLGTLKSYPVVTIVTSIATATRILAYMF